MSATLIERVKTEILDRFIAGIKADGIGFRGMLFPGLMLTEEGPKVLEFNCRLAIRRPRCSFGGFAATCSICSRRA